MIPSEYEYEYECWRKAVGLTVLSVNWDKILWNCWITAIQVGQDSMVTPESLNKAVVTKESITKNEMPNA